MICRYQAGVYEQNVGFVVWSRHSTETLARRAARRYARRNARIKTGGALTWAGGVRFPDGTERWYSGDGRVIAWPT